MGTIYSKPWMQLTLCTESVEIPCFTLRSVVFLPQARFTKGAHTHTHTHTQAHTHTSTNFLFLFPSFPFLLCSLSQMSFPIGKPTLFAATPQPTVRDVYVEGYLTLQKKGKKAQRYWFAYPDEVREKVR